MGVCQMLKSVRIDFMDAPISRLDPSSSLQIQTGQGARAGNMEST
jgi:hypothetical protein